MLKTMTKEAPRYAPYESSDDVAVDPWQIPRFHPDPTQVFTHTWLTQTAPDESVVGEVFVFGQRPMAIVEDATRRTIGIRNPLTGEVRFVPMDEARFGWDQLSKHRLETYRKTELAMKNTRLARAMQGKSARAPHYDVAEKWRKNNGNPNRKTEFKWPTIGYKPKLISQIK